MMEPSHSLADRLDADFAPAWRPEPGEKIVGEVVAISERDGGFGRYPIVTLRGDSGRELAVHAVHTVLRERLAEAAPKVGERLGIKYEGKRESERSASGTYHAYRVAVDRADGLDWSRYSDDAPAPEHQPDPQLVPGQSEVHAPLPADPPAQLHPSPTSDDDIPF